MKTNESKTKTAADAPEAPHGQAHYEHVMDEASNKAKCLAPTAQPQPDTATTRLRSATQPDKELPPEVAWLNAKCHELEADRDQYKAHAEALAEALENCVNELATFRVNAGSARSVLSEWKARKQ